MRDIERCLVYYRDVLGLHVSADRIEEFPHSKGAEPTRRRAVFLRWEEQPLATYILLDQQLSKSATGEPKQLFEIGIHHFGFWVDDLNTIMQRVRAAGVEIVSGDENRPGADSEWYGEKPGQGKIRNVILRDPEGNCVQLDQRESA